MSESSVLERLAAGMLCDDNSCCCIPRRTTVIVISIINFFGCLVDLMASEGCFDACCDARELPESARKFLTTLFQMANLLLLIATILEVALLVDIYVWYTLGFIVMGFVVTLYGFVAKMQRESTRSSLVTFIPEVVFFFVIFRCLSLVDAYRRHLHGVAA